MEDLCQSGPKINVNGKRFDTDDTEEIRRARRRLAELIDGRGAPAALCEK
jgi:hypothetical protein